MIPKFRVFEKERKIMCKVEELVFGENGDLRKISYYWEEYGEYLSTSNLDDVTLMQSTNLLDKNGVEIYEGDILHWTSEVVAREDWIGLVERINAEFNVWTSKRARSSGGWLNVAAEKIEVIGNIYENPELIE